MMLCVSCDEKWHGLLCVCVYITAEETSETKDEDEEQSPSRKVVPYVITRDYIVAENPYRLS